MLNDDAYGQNAHPALPHPLAPIRVEVNIQGGGTHTAYAAGALMRLAEDPRIAIRHLCGTSGGAMNAIAFASGYNRGADLKQSRALGIASLSELWKRVGDEGSSFVETIKGPFYHATYPNLPALESAAAIDKGLTSLIGMFDAAARAFPMNFPGMWASQWAQSIQSAGRAAPQLLAANALRAAIRPYATPTIDGEGRERLIFAHAAFPPAHGTHVTINTAALERNGTFTNHLWTGKDLTMEAALASGAILPVFDTQTINGKRHADGAYAQNPPMQPHETRRDVDAVLTIMHNPAKGPLAPKPYADMKAADTAYTDGLVLHQAFGPLAAMVQDSYMRGYKGPSHHALLMDKPAHWDASSKQNPDRRFIAQLIQNGYHAMDRELTENGYLYGIRTTALPQMGLGTAQPQVRQPARVSGLPALATA